METLKLLIVDDEPGMRMGAIRTLKDFRFRVRQADAEVALLLDQAESGEEGLEKIASDAPDILLLDHKLPGISGMQVLERLPKTGREILTIVITAYASIDTAIKATKEGAYDFLSKPFTPSELKYAVEKAAAHIVLTRRAQHLAEERKRIRFDFIRVLGHELKAPLSSVENYVSLLQNKTLGSNLADYEKVVQRSALRLEQMRKLIVDLLDMTKIESGNRPREITLCDLREIAERAIEGVEQQAAAKQVCLELHAPPVLPFSADRSDCEMIINNLVSNAVKYNKDGGRVDITLNLDNSTARITVSDTGIGIAQDDTAKLFNEFVRIKNEHTRNILGSGLGLSIVKRLVQLYDGEVSVNSEPGAGSTFSLTLKSEPQVQA